MPAALLLLALLAACENDLDALYDQGGAGEAADPGPPPRLPARPDPEYEDDCEACAREQCGSEYDACLEDDDCVAMLRCNGKCDNPACLLECEADHHASAWFDDYWRCVFTGCQTECNTGDNLGCAGNYDWPAASDARFEVEFDFDRPARSIPPSGQREGRVLLAGIEVRSCLDQEECSANARLDAKEVGLDNTVRLQVAAGAVSPLDYRGYLEIDAPELGSYGERVRYYGYPIARPGSRSAWFLPNWVAQQRDAWIGVFVSDCLRAGSRGVRLEVTDYPDAQQACLGVGLPPCPPSGATGIGALVGLSDLGEPRQVRVRALGPDGEQTWAERAVWVRPGWETFLPLPPAARGER